MTKKFTMTGAVAQPVDIERFVPPLTTAQQSKPKSSYNFYEAASVICAPDLSNMSITDNDSNDVSADEIANILANPIYEEGRDNAEANKEAISLLATLTGLDIAGSHIAADRILTLQDLAVNNLPDPAEKNVIYTAATDVIPAAENYTDACASKAGYGVTAQARKAAQILSGSIGATFQPDTLGVSFADHAAFTEFIEELMRRADAMAKNGIINKTTHDMCKQLSKLPFTSTTLTQALRLRRLNEDTADYSFARVLLTTLHAHIKEQNNYAQSNNTGAPVAWAPFTLRQLIKPQHIIFINAEAHASSTARAVTRHWEKIQRSLSGGPTILSMRKITKLEDSNDLLSGAKEAVTARQNRKEDAKKHGHKPKFSASAPPPKKSLTDIMALIQNTTSAQSSKTKKRVVKKTYARANRRNPDDPNIMGKIISSQQARDIHFFADTSGSMSLEDYRDTTMLLMLLAKKLKVNFYFSTFSHVLSPPVEIKVKGKSPAQLKHMLETIPKVTGGTDFGQVYDFINSHPSYQERINIMATDFGWWPGYNASRIKHPERLYYVPSFDRSSSYAWNNIKYYAQNFAKSMLPHEPDITSRFMGM